MKKKLANRLETIKQWGIKEKYFFILLATMLTFLTISMFTQYTLIACLLVAVVCAVLFNFEKCLSLYLFSYGFEAVFYAQISGKNVFIFPIFYSIIFGICAIKYIIKVFKKEAKINWKIVIPFLIFMVYLVLPINPINLYDTFKFIVALVFIYLLIENRGDVKFDNLIIYAVFGLVISIFLSIFIKYSPRMSSYVGAFHNYGIRKMQGMFTNPNFYVEFSVLLMAIISYKCVFHDLMWGVPLLVLIPYSYGTISRNFILCMGIICIFIFICLCVARKKVFFLKGLSIFLVVAIACFSQFDTTKLYVKRLGLLGNSSAEQEIDKSNEFSDGLIDNIENDLNDSQEVLLWTDGKPMDPGRLELWKRYVKDIVSNPKNIIFGRGISADSLGVPPHNTYIYIIWQLGVIGILISSYIFYLIYRNLLKKNVITLLTLILVCFICFFEGNVFNYVSIMMITILSCEDDYKLKKQKQKEET